MTDHIMQDNQVSTAPAPTFPDLLGKVALVTGGSRGIGAAIARLFAANGVKVAVNGRDVTAMNSVVEEIESSGGHALGVPANHLLRVLNHLA